MNPPLDGEGQGPFPLELVYAILDSLISSEVKLQEIGPEDALSSYPSVDLLLPVMLVSKPLYRYTMPLIFRDVKCSSTARLHSLNEILQANHSLASFVKRFRIEPSVVRDLWLEDPMLPKVLDLVTNPGLDSLIIRGPHNIIGAPGLATIPLQLSRAVGSLTSQPGRLRQLHLFRLKLSSRLFDELGAGIDFLEVRRVICLDEEIPPETQMLDVERFQTNHITSLSIARIATTWPGFGPRNPSLPLLRKLIIPEMLLSISDKHRLDMTRMQAPNLISLRFIAFHERCLDQFYDINELCGSGPFRQLEIVQEFAEAPQYAVPDSTIIYFLSKAAQHLALETLTIVASTNLAARVNQPGSGQSITEFKERREELYRVLDQPFFARVHRVVLDFRGVAFNHPQVFTRMLPQIRSLFPEETFQGSHVNFALEHRF
ncbi:hypothetical protein MD484_g8191, partial [Candolleomyces efflorescens]